MGNEGDDFMLWKLECMTEPTLRWEMVAFVAWCEEGTTGLTRLMPSCPYNWADPRNETGL